MLFIFSACGKFLNVQPHDRLTKEQVISSEQGINMVLNGIYLNMAQGNLYGANLSITILEALAQRWDIENTASALHYFARYDFTSDQERRAERENANMWESLYVQALGVNDFMVLLDNTPTSIIPQHRQDWLRGEALALRAFYHFDILRIWGPVPENIYTTEGFMPYNNSPTGGLAPLKKADTILELIMADLYEAERLLSNDPVISRGVDTTITFDQAIDFYFSNRNYRMNYFAIKALQARVYLWKASNPNALNRMQLYQRAEAAAREVIERGGRHFPWISPNDIQTGSNPDRIFSTEIIFGIRNRDMYSRFDRLFAMSVSVQNRLAPRADRLRQTFGIGIEEDDFRYFPLWRESGGDEGREFRKYMRPNDRGTTNVTEAARRRLRRTEFFQPLIRISEMYYIIAEARMEQGFPREAIWDTYMHPVLRARNIALASGEPKLENRDLRVEITREYQKEFWGEGQLFFYYKRLNMVNDIPDAKHANAMMTGVNFRLPIPEAELISR